MAARFTNLDTIHIPTNGKLVPVSWGTGVNENMDFLARTPHFACSTTGDNNALLGSGSLTELSWDWINSHSGDFFQPTETSVTTFVAPYTAFYMASCSIFIAGDSVTESNPNVEVSMRLNDESYLMRSSQHLLGQNLLINGMVYMRAGDTFAFNALQTTGEDVYVIEGYCGVVYMGGS